jgi:purine-binding chemotaxis protein CheW
MQEAAKTETVVPLDKQTAIFRLHDEFFGFAICLIDEIVEVSPLNMVPKAPDFVAGVMNSHGRIVAVISLARFFGLPSHEKGPQSRIMIYIPEDFNVGFLVDSIEEIASIEWEMEEGNPMEGDSVQNKYIEKVVSLDERLINIIDMRKLVADLEDYFKEVDVEY